MKAAVYTRYGPPEVLAATDVAQPVPGQGDVLIRICATSVTATDCTFRQGKPLFSRLYTGLTKPKNAVLGSEFAGVVEAVGSDVTAVRAGDEVFGTCKGHGAYAEYICLSEQEAAIAIKPTVVSFDEAVACCDGSLTALAFLRDKGHIRWGHEVLIYGASGSVGTAAVQLASYFGAQVTAVCSTSNLELVHALGAGKVIDYTKEEFTRSGESYDIIFDTVGKMPFTRCRRSLKKHGVFLESGIGAPIFVAALLTEIAGGRKARIYATGLRPAAERRKDLTFLGELIEAGRLRPVIDRRYPLEHIAEAHRYVDQGHKRGNVIITLAPAA